MHTQNGVTVAVKPYCEKEAEFLFFQFGSIHPMRHNNKDGIHWNSNQRKSSKVECAWPQLARILHKSQGKCELNWLH